MRKSITFWIGILLIPFTIGVASCQQNNSSKGGAKGGKVSVEEFDQLLAKTQTPQLIDVRTPDEFAGGHLAGAKNIPLQAADFETQVNALNKEQPVFVYCLSGGRSSSAASFMRESGFKTVYEMPGITAWNAAGKKVETAADAPAKNGMSTAEFQQAVSGPNYVLVDFNAVWCKPCIKMKPILRKIASEREDKMKMLEVDADENQDLLASKNIDGIPYLELYKDGKLVWQHKGFIDEATFLKETGL